MLAPLAQYTLDAETETSTGSVAMTALFQWPTHDESQ